MTAGTYSLTFNGYRPDANGLPAYSGIYCVYACTHNALVPSGLIRKLLYIGESTVVRFRVLFHERREDWERELSPGDSLRFSSAPITPDSDRKRAEAAMINHHRPPCNSEYVDSFPYEPTSIWTSGCNELLAPCFTVETTSNEGAGGLFGAPARW